MNEDFEKGKECQRLETQISALYEEIFLGSGKDHPEQQARLRDVAKETWDKYLKIAVHYHLGKEILRVEEIFHKALGEEYPKPLQKPACIPF